MNTSTSKILLLVTLLIFSQACRTAQIAQQEPLTNDQLYREAVLDAMAPSSAKVYDDLIPINADNTDLIRKNINGEEFILVVSWKYDTSHYKPNSAGYYNTGKYQIWVTAAPELQQRMQQEAAEDVELRLKQMLGLPPDAIYCYFIEFWVRPADLFRPCPDSEIDDRECSLCFPAKTDNYYIAWFNDSRIDRYYDCDLENKYPWTQLGYTYDWNPTNTSHVGLCEFVIDTNKDIIIHEIYTTAAYLEGEK